MSRIDAVLADARSQFDRVPPEDLAREIKNGAIVIDIRPDHDRTIDGTLPGAIILERNVLEWRLDPTSEDRIPEATGDESRFILVCNDGYASSLAVLSLRALGLVRATDLAGGYRSWRALGREPR
jgi:rhodanese-related sulfurtransferase